jgi:preprotein translocase subunit YajC
MLFALHLLAQPDPTPQQPGGGLIPIATMVVIFVLFYVFLVRGPMKKQEQERKNLLAAMKKNDKVITSGGIIGIVASVSEKEDEVTLKVDESSNVRLKVLKSSITRIVTGDEPAKDEKKS